MTGKLLLLMVLLGFFAVYSLSLAQAQGTTPEPKVKDLILATTTSTVDTGLLDVLNPIFEKKTGFRVKTISVGTGQALAMGDVIYCREFMFDHM